MVNEDYLHCSAYEGQALHPTEANFTAFFHEESKLNFFALLDADGAVLLKSEGYPQEASRENGIQSVIKNRPNRDFYSVKELEGEYYLSLRAANYREIARTCRHKTEAEALALLPFVTGQQIRKRVVTEAVAAATATTAAHSNDRREDDYLACHFYENHPSVNHEDGMVKFTHENGKNYFAWYDKNNQLLLRSEGYPTTAARDNGYASVLKNRDLEERYAIEEKMGYYFAYLKAGNHQEIARGCGKKTYEEAAALYPSARAEAKLKPTMVVTPIIEAPKVSIPTVGVPKVSVPVIEVPKLEVPVIAATAAAIAASIPHIELPEAEVPHVEVPTIEIPHVEIPHVEVPHVEIPTIEIPKVEVPHVEIPHVEIPTIEIPKVEVPHVAVPVVAATLAAVAATVPHMELPKLEAPHIQVPHLELPKVEVPHVAVPVVAATIAAVAATVPHVELPKLEAPHVQVPHLELPKVEVPHVVVPVVVPTIAAVAATVPHVELPKLEAPHVQVPHLELPKVEVPHVVVPVVAATLAAVAATVPHVEIPKVEIPKVTMEVPKVEIPKVEVPKVVVEAPKVEVPKVVVEAPNVEIKKVVAAATAITAAVAVTNIPHKKEEFKKVVTPVTPIVETPIVEEKSWLSKYWWLPLLLLLGLGFLLLRSYNTETPTATVTAPIPIETPKPVVSEAPKVAEVPKVITPSCNLHWIYFGYDKSDLSADSKKELDHLADLLKENKGSVAVLKGYTDGKGDVAYNDALSKRRANAARAYLTGSKKISDAQIKEDAAGKSAPVAKNTDDDSGRKYNRRVELYIQDATGKNICESVESTIPTTLKE